MLQGQGGAGGLGAGLIGVPAAEVVALAGGGGGQGDLGAVGGVHRGDVVTALGVVGQGVVLPGVADLQDGAVRVHHLAVSALKVRVGILLHRGVDEGILHAEAVYFLDEAVAVPVEVLQHVMNLVGDGVGDIFHLLVDGDQIRALLRPGDGGVQVRLRDGDGGNLRIVDLLRGVRLGGFIHLGGRGHLDGDGQVLLLKLLDGGVELILLAGVVDVIETHPGLENPDVLKLGRDGEALVHQGVLGDLLVLVVEPACKAETALEGRLRQGLQPAPGGGIGLLGVGLPVHLKGHHQVAGEAGLGGDGAGDHRVRGDLHVIVKPAQEVRALPHRVCGQQAVHGGVLLVIVRGHHGVPVPELHQVRVGILGRQGDVPGGDEGALLGKRHGAAVQQPGGENTALVVRRGGGIRDPRPLIDQQLVHHGLAIHKGHRIHGIAPGLAHRVPVLRHGHGRRALEEHQHRQQQGQQTAFQRIAAGIHHLLPPIMGSCL